MAICRKSLHPAWSPPIPANHHYFISPLATSLFSVNKFVNCHTNINTPNCQYKNQHIHKTLFKLSNNKNTPSTSMENSTYAESGASGSSAQSRDPDFESPRPWDDQNNNHQKYNTKVKFMCSYGGKILPRPYDNQLSYVGGQTKILAVDRSVKFASLIARLTALCEAHDVCFKYQLPGEDLDALISVTNDDDLEHMMHEYDRLNKGANTATTATARLRLFLFPVTAQSPSLTPVSSFSSNQQQVNGGRIEKETEVVVLDESDHIKKHIHDLQKLQIEEQQQQNQLVFNRRPSNDNLAAAGYTGEYLVPKMNEKVAPVSGYQISGGYTSPSLVSMDQQLQHQQQAQTVYMVQAPGSVYHAPIATPVTGQVNQGQGYYVQRMPEVYHEQQVYNVMPPVQAISTQQTTVSAQQQFLPQGATYTEGYHVVQSTTAVTDQGFGQVAYDNGAGRQIYYTTTTQGAAVVAQQQQPQQLLQSLQPTVQQQYQAMAAAQENGSKVVTGNIKDFM